MLAVVPIRQGALPAGGLETVAECDGRVLLIGSGVAAAADDVDRVASTIITIETADYAPAAWSMVLAAQLGDEPHIVLPASPDGRDLAPRIAAAMQRDLWAGAISITPHRIDLARNGGLVINEIVPGAAFVATLQPGIRGVEAAAIAGHGQRERVITVVEFAPPEAGSAVDAHVIGVLPPDVATMDLAESPRIVGGGAGLTKATAFGELTTVAALLDASMGATRVITDRGWVGHERQIGTTGVVVDPQLYIAFGISGAVQHTSGLGQPDHIISINTDPHCPMMQLADLAIVSDANVVITELLQRLDGHA